MMGLLDDSEAIICGYNDNRIYYVKNPVNWLIKTLNKGIDLWREYIARMDAG